MGYIGSCVDITERYQAEQALKISKHQLTRSNADLLQFTHIAAHHLQEPARRIVSFVQRLKTELIEVSNLSEEASYALQFIEQSALRQRALVQDIQLYLACAEPRAVVQAVDVNDTLTKVIAHNEALIRETHARIDYGNLPPARIDRPRLYDIFNILLDNALRYRHPERTPHIYIIGKKQADRVRYYIVDNGLGIPAQYHERVFLVFERLQINDNQTSTGVGLAIVRRIVESCGGTASLHETVGGGVTILFDLPTDI
jgi:light-regulated signal transduction histidine kinase (bacteriophytochrome)